MQLNINKIEKQLDTPVLNNTNLLSEEFHVSNVFNELLQSTSELICKYSNVNISDKWLEDLAKSQKKIYLKYDYNVNNKQLIINNNYANTNNYHIYLQFEYDKVKNSIISVEYNKSEINIIVNFFVCKYIYTNTYFDYKTQTDEYFIKFCRIKLKHEFLHLTEMYATPDNPIKQQFNDKLLINCINKYKNQLTLKEYKFILQVFYYMKTSEQHARINGVYQYIVDLDNQEIFDIIKNVNINAKLGQIGKNLYCFFQDDNFIEHSKNNIMSYINEMIITNDHLKNIINEINKTLKYFKYDICTELKQYQNSLLRIIYKALQDNGYSLLYEYQQYLCEAILFNNFNIDETVLIKFKKYLQL